MRISDWSSDVCSSDLAVIFPSSDRIYKILFATIGDCDSDESNSVDASSDQSVGEYSASVPSLLTAISRPPARIGPVQRIGSFFFFSVSMRQRARCWSQSTLPLPRPTPSSLPTSVLASPPPHTPYGVETTP